MDAFNYRDSHLKLLVGDPHVTAEELDDCQALLDLVFETVTKNRVSHVIFLGDLHHNHTLAHVEVTAFWDRNLRRLGKMAQVVVLLGNHDMSTSGKRHAHALLAYKDIPGVRVVDEPCVFDGVAAVPYCVTEEEFVSHANSLKDCDLLICHQTFAGSKYDNAFYAPDGFNQERVPQKKIVSGHIHLPQTIGKVWYPGSPRWRTTSDANVVRGIWLYDEQQEKPVLVPSIHCRPIFCTVIEDGVVKSGPPVRPAGPGKMRWHVDVHGPAAENVAEVARLSALGYRTRRFDRLANHSEVRESAGVHVSWDRWLSTQSPLRGTPPEVLKKMAQERLCKNLG